MSEDFKEPLIPRNSSVLFNAQPFPKVPTQASIRSHFSDASAGLSPSGSSINSSQDSLEGEITNSQSTVDFNAQTTSSLEPEEEKPRSYFCISPHTRQRLNLVTAMTTLSLKSLTTGVFLYDVLRQNIYNLGTALGIIDVVSSPVSKSMAVVMAGASGVQTFVLANPIEQEVQSAEECSARHYYLKFNQSLAFINFSLASLAIISNFSNLLSSSPSVLAPFVMLNWLVDVNFYFMYMGPNIKRHALDFCQLLGDIKEGKLPKPSLKQLPLMLDTLFKVGGIALFRTLTNAMNAQEIPILLKNVLHIQKDFNCGTGYAAAMASLGFYMMCFTKFLPINLKNFNPEFDDITYAQLKDVRLSKRDFAGDLFLTSLQAAAGAGLVYRHGPDSELGSIVAALSTGLVLEVSGIYTDYYLRLREQYLIEKSMVGESCVTHTSYDSKRPSKGVRSSFVSVEINSETKFKPELASKKKIAVIFMYDHIEENAWGATIALIEHLRKKKKSVIFISERMIDKEVLSDKGVSKKHKIGIQCSAGMMSDNGTGQSLEQRQLNCIKRLQTTQGKDLVIVAHASDALRRDNKKLDDESIIMVPLTRNIQHMYQEIRAIIKCYNKSERPSTSGLVQEVKELLPARSNDPFNTINFIAQSAKPIILLGYCATAGQLLWGENYSLAWQDQLIILGLALPIVRGEYTVHQKRMQPIIGNHHLKLTVLGREDEPSLCQRFSGFFKPIDSFKAPTLIRTKLYLKEEQSHDEQADEDHKNQETLSS